MVRANWLEYHKVPVTLHSGGKSHWLVRGDKIFADERLRKTVLAYWETFVRQLQKPYHFVSIPTGGDHWAEAIAARVGGEWSSLYDVLPAGRTMFVVDDVLTTGASLSAMRGQMQLIVVDRMQRERYVPNVVAWATMYLPVEK